MRVVIAGSRDIHDYALLERAILASGFTISEVVSGMQDGVDNLGLEWAMKNDVKMRGFWPTLKNDPRAYRGRNLAMAQYAEALIAIPGPKRAGRGDGTANMLMHARAYGLKIYIHELEG